MKSLSTLVAALVITVSLPAAASAYVEYGAWYQGNPPYYPLHYQPMYAYSYAPVQSTTINQPQYFNQPNYQTSYMSQPGYPYGYQNYNYYPSYGYGYQAQPSPAHPGYPTGETMPWLGGQLCTFPDYNGRALCGSNPNQYVYDHWTGTWY